MTLDCTNLKPGDRVRLRNGEIRTITARRKSCVSILSGDQDWYDNGSFYGDTDEPFELDIIEILPPEPPTDCTSRQKAMAKARQITGDMRKNMESTASTRVLTLTHDRVGYEHPDVIDCNGKRYVPVGTFGPFILITRPDEGAIAIRYDERLFTPAAAWPEPITDREPTKEDADGNGSVQWLVDDGWTVDGWDIDREECDSWYKGWAHTPAWKPKPTPAHTREELLRAAREISAAGSSIGGDLLDSIITHLESIDE